MNGKDFALISKLGDDIKACNFEVEKAKVRLVEAGVALHLNTRRQNHDGARYNAEEIQQAAKRLLEMEGIWGKLDTKLREADRGETDGG